MLFKVLLAIWAARVTGKGLPALLSQKSHFFRRVRPEVDHSQQDCTEEKVGDFTDLKNVCGTMGT